MSDLIGSPLWSAAYASIRSMPIEQPAAYIFAQSAEDRSRLAPDWMQRHSQTLFVEIAADEARRLAFSWQAEGVSRDVRLRSESDLDAFAASVARPRVYIDITGLPHFVWVPLVRTFLRHSVAVDVVYSEPQHYLPGRNTTAAGTYELSDRIANAEPLPGFASLDREVSPPVLVPLLGFEGGRFARIQEIVQTTGERTFPVIGVPGFELEYPFIAYFGNRLPLKSDDCFMNLSFASANCPFSLLSRLEQLESARFPTDASIKVALVGTKPHALGALLYFLRSTRSVELVYDHPIKSVGRTTGTTRCWMYSVSSLSYRPEKLTSMHW